MGIAWYCNPGDPTFPLYEHRKFVLVGEADTKRAIRYFTGKMPQRSMESRRPYEIRWDEFTKKKLDYYHSHRK